MSWSGTVFFATVAMGFLVLVNTALDEHLKNLGVTQVVVVGVARIFPRLGETGTTEEIIALLDSGHDDGRA